MDFSQRNSHAFNDQDDLNQASDQELLRRLAASRAVNGLPPQDSAMYGMGSRYGPTQGGPGMFGQGPAGQSRSSTGATGVDSRFSMMQQAEEEELLLQLLLARRRRQDTHQDGPPDRHNHTAFADELLRLRQAGNAAAASSAATAAMFAADQEHQMYNQQQGPSMRGNPMRGNPMFGNAPGFMMQDQGHMMSGLNSNFASGGRRLDDYLLRTQQQHPQESILAGDGQQRIELSQSRFLSLHQQQQASGFMDMGMGSHGKRDFHDMNSPGGGDMEKVEPPMKKKRFHKKKPSDMPRRPLSAYNLFFSEERERILKEIDDKDGGEKKVGEDGEKKEEAMKPRALLRPLLPSEKKRRPHRKTHGKISFRLLAQMVGQRWKALPDDRRKYYQDLAKEDMIRQKRAMEEYYLKQTEKVKTLDKKDKDAEDREKAEEKEAPVKEECTAAAAP